MDNDNEEQRVDWHDRATIIAVLDNTDSIEIQDCHSTQFTWDKLQGRYASKSAIIKLGLLDNVLNIKQLKGADTGDHVSTLEARFCILASMGSSISESMKIALLLSAMSNLLECRPIISSLNSLQREMATFNHVSMIFIDEYKCLLNEDRSYTKVHDLKHQL